MIQNQSSKSMELDTIDPIDPNLTTEDKEILDNSQINSESKTMSNPRWLNELDNFLQSQDPLFLKSNIDMLRLEFDKSGLKNPEIKMSLILHVMERKEKYKKDVEQYKQEYEEYYRDHKMYVKNQKLASLIHEITSGNTNIIGEPEKEPDLLKLVLTPYKIRQELLTYELLHYKQTKKIKFSNKNFIEISEKIKQDIDRFNLLIDPYVESKNWSVHYKDTLNFSVPKNRVAFVNTIEESETENMNLDTHVNMLIKYIARNYKIKSQKYIFPSDNKYVMAWVIILIGYVIDE